MLELPESVTMARQLNEAVKGRRIEEVWVNQSAHRFAFFFGPPEAYPDLLEGRVLGPAQAWGGLVELCLDNVRLAFGDGSNLRLLAPQTALPKKHQLALRLDDGSHLVCTVQMYGGIWAFEEGQNDNFYYLVAKEKPSPLADEFDRSYFFDLLDSVKPALSAKAFLATEQRIPGLGNGTLQDILFHARIHPKSAVGVLDGEEREAMFRSVKETLKAMAEQGGRDTERDLFGHPGGYRTSLSKNTLAEPCPVCGSAIQRQTYLGGNVYFCPICQSPKK